MKLPFLFAELVELLIGVPHRSPLILLDSNQFYRHRVNLLSNVEASVHLAQKQVFREEIFLNNKLASPLSLFDPRRAKDLLTSESDQPNL